MKIGYKRYNNIEDKYSAYINECKLPKKSKDKIKEWAEERRGNKYRDKNNLGLIGTIINIGEPINKCLTKITKKDLQEFFSENDFEPTTELWYKKCLKRFYYWLSKNEDDPKYLVVVNWIDTKKLAAKCSEAAKKKREDNLLSPKEVRKMISKATLLRDKLAISLLADTGIRAESVGASENKRSINVGQIKFKKGYAIIENIQEKADKKRDVIVTEALSYLIKYWNELPEEHKQKPDNPLFIGYASNRYGHRWGYTGLKNMLHRVSKESIGRRINPHDFRHLKATRLHVDESLSDDSKCKLMGWSSRRMLDRYNHTTFEEAKDEYLAKKGIIKLEDKKRKVEAAILRPKECLVCHNVNGLSDSICEKCGNSLNYEQMIKDFTQRQKSEEEIAKFIKPVEIQKLFKMMYKLQKQIEGIKKTG